MNKILTLISKHYRRYHDLLFYLLTLAVIALATLLAIHITKQKNEQEYINLQEKQIAVEEFTIRQKPIYVALQEAGLTNREVFDIVNKLEYLKPKTFIYTCIYIDLFLSYYTFC